MAEPGLEPSSFDLTVFLPGSSGAVLFTPVPMSQEDSGLKFPQCQAEEAETSYQPTRVTGRKLGPLQKPEASEEVEETGGRSMQWLRVGVGRGRAVLRLSGFNSL